MKFEKRGSVLARLLDRRLGVYMSLILSGICNIKKKFYKNDEASEKNNILIVCYGALGDLLLASLVLRQIKHTNGCKYHLACTKSNRPVADLFKEDVYENVELVKLSDPFCILNVCKRNNIDVVIDTTQWAQVSSIHIGCASIFLKRSIFSVGFLSDYKKRINIYDSQVKHQHSVHEITNFSNLLNSTNADFIFATEDKLADLSSVMPGRNNISEKSAVLHAWPSGVKSSLKEWPKENWISLSKELVSLGYTVYFTGTSSDSDRIIEMMSKINSKKVKNIAGLYDIQGLAEFMRNHVALCISVNTGILHLSTYSGVKTIALNGPTNPARWGAVGDCVANLQPSSGEFGYLSYGFEYPKKGGYALDFLLVKRVIEAVEDMENLTKSELKRSANECF